MTTNWSVAGSQRHTDGRAKAGDAWQHGVMAAEPADASEVIHLWQDERPVRIDDVGPEVAYSAPAGLAAGTTFLRNISVPTLSVFTPRLGVANGVGVIVVPGGGWTINAWDHEGRRAGHPP